MRTLTSYENLETHLEPGHVYRREDLLLFSKAIDRDLNTLVEKGLLEKIGAGLYYKPELSRFGILPPKESDVIKSFLRDENFLMLSRNQYNLLGMGLTQIYNSLIVYNYKRHGKFNLGNIQFDFRRPARGFPESVSPEYLLVDLVNNMDELSEETNDIKEKIKDNIHNFDINKLMLYVKKYGKIFTQHLFKELID
jgi:hypothetical protein